MVGMTAGIGGLAVSCACLAARAPVLAWAAGCGYKMTFSGLPGLAGGRGAGRGRWAAGFVLCRGMCAGIAMCVRSASD